jgi:phage tail sheath protein FI
LVPAVEPRAFGELHRRQINVLRDDARGFLALSAQTLALDPLLVELGASRTLVLVRRLVRREAQAHVFENNGPTLRDRLRDDFERFMARIWRAGGLAGAKPDEAFEVVCDARNNDARMIDAGRLLVEIRFAPSKPLAFLAVRLVESGRTGGALEVA